MHPIPTALCLTLIATATGTAAPERHALSGEGPWFTAAGSLRLPAIDEPAMLLDIVREYERITDQRVTMEPETRKRLAQTKVGFFEAFEVPSEAVTEVFGHLLQFNDLALTIARERQPRILELHDLALGKPRLIGEPPDMVDLDGLDGYAGLPASVVVTTLPLHAIDARVVTNSMRMQMTSMGSVEECIALGEHAMLLSGYAAQVKWRVQALSLADEDFVKQPASDRRRAEKIRGEANMRRTLKRRNRPKR